MYEGNPHTYTLSMNSTVSKVQGFFNFALTTERFMTISVNRVTTHSGLPKSQLPDSSASESELSSLQMSWVWCQSVGCRRVYDLVFKM